MKKIKSNLQITFSWHLKHVAKKLAAVYADPSQQICYVCFKTRMALSPSIRHLTYTESTTMHVTLL